MEMHQSGCQAYTLRLSPAGLPGVWRVTLYSAQTGERWRFANLEQLYDFLHQAVTDVPRSVDRPVAPAAQGKTGE